MKNEDHCAMKVKPMLSVRTHWSWCLLFPSRTQASLQVSEVALCIHERGSFLTMTCVFSLTWFICPVQWTTSFSFLSLFGSLHICSHWSVSFCCQVCLGKFYFPKLACHFCLWRNFMSSLHLIHLTILFSSGSGLLLCPQVTFFNIKVHYPWLPGLKGVGERQTKSTSLKTA